MKAIIMVGLIIGGLVLVTSLGGARFGGSFIGTIALFLVIGIVIFVGDKFYSWKIEIYWHKTPNSLETFLEK